MSDSQSSKPRINPWSIWLIIIVMAGGLMVYYSWVSTLKRQAGDGRPMLGERLETNLNLVNQFGDAVKLGDLKGKVYLCNYVFTRCPGQCSGVSAIMKDRLGDWKNHPLFRMASISLDPAHDQPEDMLEFSKKFELESDQWWFLTGDDGEIDKYMRQYFKFTRRLKAPEERDSELDLYDHQALIALVDHGGHIRGLYEVFNPKNPERALQYQERLKTDLEKVMVEAMEAIPEDSLPEVRRAKNWKVEGDIELQRHDMESVKFSDLEGKVTLLSHVFTRCPFQCPGICAALGEIRKDFASHDDLMIASMTMDPEHDTPEVLKKFAEGHNLVADNWWFLTGEKEALTEFMVKKLLFAQQVKPEAERAVPTDIYDHDFKVALMNRENVILDWYDFAKEDEIVRLREDLEKALDAGAEE